MIILFENLTDFLCRANACNFLMITPYPFRSVHLFFAGWDMLTYSMSGYTCGGKTRFTQTVPAT